MPACVRCGGDITAVRVFRQTLCPHCDAYLHACVQCSFHDPTASNQCLEPQAEHVANREKANFCEFFRLGGPATRRGGGSSSGGRGTGDTRHRFDDLFRRPDGD